MPESLQATNGDSRAGAAVIARLLLGVGLCCLALSCSRAVFQPPVGPGDPAPDAPAAWADATAGCRDLQSYSAALRASGRVGDARLWPIGIEVAVLANQSIYLGATAAGRAIFLLAGAGDDATLWLRREQRTVTAPPARIMDAIMGVPVTPADLLGVLTGCVAAQADLIRAVRHGRLLTIETAGARVHLASRSGRWRVRAAETSAFTVEYADAPAALPQELWLWPASGAGSPAAIHLTVSDARINEPVPASVFRVPAGAAEATPMTLDELRSGALWKNRAASPERSRWPEP